MTAVRPAKHCSPSPPSPNLQAKGGKEKSGKEREGSDRVPPRSKADILLFSCACKCRRAEVEAYDEVKTVKGAPKACVAKVHTKCSTRWPERPDDGIHRGGAGKVNGTHVFCIYMIEKTTGKECLAFWVPWNFGLHNARGIIHARRPPTLHSPSQ